MAGTELLSKKLLPQCGCFFFEVRSLLFFFATLRSDQDGLEGEQKSTIMRKNRKDPHRFEGGTQISSTIPRGVEIDFNGRLEIYLEHPGTLKPRSFRHGWK